MLNKDELLAHKAALQAAGLDPSPQNTGILSSGAMGEPGQFLTASEELALIARQSLPSLGGFTGSSDPRLAKAAKRKLEELKKLPEADPSLYESPEETASLTEQSIEERLKNAANIASGIPDDYVYGEDP